MSAHTKLTERLAAALYEADNVIESWSDASDGDRAEYLAIAGEEATGLLAIHAHELAERLREFIGPEAYPGESEHIHRFVLGWRHAADYADPEVTA